MAGTKKKVNINDIAVAAGVSKTTVSRYLNGRPDLMSEKTRERIKSIIELLDYQPSDIARNLKLKRTNLIGVIVADMSSPFSASLIVAMGEYFTDRGYVPLFADSGNSQKHEEDIVNMLLSKGVAGLLVNTYSYVNPNMISVACRGIPIVLCDRYIQNYRFNIVTVDNSHALHGLVAHLKAQGYTRLALFTQPPENNSSRSHRRDAFLSAVRSLYGYDPSEDVYILKDRPDGDYAALQLSRFMGNLRPGDIPAVICTNSVTTVLAYKAIRNAGLRIPQDIGICGPDDWDWDTTMTWSMLLEPAITTFSIPTKEMGRRSAALLLDLLQNPEQEPQELLLPSELRVRASTSRSPRQGEA